MRPPSAPKASKPARPKPAPKQRTGATEAVTQTAGNKTQSIAQPTRLPVAERKITQEIPQTVQLAALGHTPQHAWPNVVSHKPTVTQLPPRPLPSPNQAQPPTVNLANVAPVTDLAPWIAEAKQKKRLGKLRKAAIGTGIVAVVAGGAWLLVLSDYSPMGPARGNSAAHIVGHSAEEGETTADGEATEATPLLDTAVAAVVTEAGYVWVDAAGAEIAQFPDNDGLVKLDGPLDQPRVLADMIAVWHELTPELQEKTRIISATTPDDIAATLHSGQVIRWGSTEQLKLKVATALALMSRVPNSPVFDVSSPALPITR